MTTPNNDLRTRIEDMRGILQCAEHTSETNEGLQAGYEANCGDVIQLSRPEYNQLFCLLSDLEKLFETSLPVDLQTQIADFQKLLQELKVKAVEKVMARASYEELIEVEGKLLKMFTQDKLFKPPSDPDTKKALEIVERTIIGENYHETPEDYDKDLQTIRTCILSLSAQLAEKEGKVERLREGNEELQRGLQRLGYYEVNGERYGFCYDPAAGYYFEKFCNLPFDQRLIPVQIVVEILNKHLKEPHNDE